MQSSFRLEKVLFSLTLSRMIRRAFDSIATDGLINNKKDFQIAYTKATGEYKPVDAELPIDFKRFRDSITNSTRKDFLLFSGTKGCCTELDFKLIRSYGTILMFRNITNGQDRMMYRQFDSIQCLANKNV